MPSIQIDQDFIEFPLIVNFIIFQRSGYPCFIIANVKGKVLVTKNLKPV